MGIDDWDLFGIHLPAGRQRICHLEFAILTLVKVHLEHVAQLRRT